MDRLEEVQTKLQLIRKWLGESGLEAIVVNSQANFAWLTGGGNNYVYTGDAAGAAQQARARVLSDELASEEAAPNRAAEAE